MFRRGYDPATLVLWVFILCTMFGIFYTLPANSAREKEDQSWLVEFCVAMLAYIILLSALAYFATEVHISCCVSVRLQNR